MTGITKAKAKARSSESGQATMFSQESPPPAPPRKPRVREPLTGPFGKPDAKGVYEYQQIGQALEQLPPDDQSRVISLMRLSYPRQKAILAVIAKYNRAQQCERDDYDIWVGI